MLTTISGCSTSGIWLTRSLLRAIRPRAIRPMMMTIVAIGFLTLKLERNISASCGSRGGGRCGRLGQLDLAAIAQGAAGVAQDAVALLQPGADFVQAEALVAL